MSNHYSLNLFPDLLVDEDMDKLQGEAFLRASARTVLKFLWQNWDEETWPSTIFDKTFFERLKNKDHSLPALFRALLKNRDPYLLKATRQEAQKILLNAFETLATNPPTTEIQQLKTKLAIHNMLSIYAMFSPTPYETLNVPQFIDGSWQLVNFQIEPIELTPKNGWWVNFLGDTDRLFSYGLKPTENTDAQSILVHCGTGWPTAQGSTIQIIADIWPYKTPGEVFFEWQHQKINTWLDQQHGKVLVTGQSLGGSLAYLTALFRPDKVDETYCLVPPGMYENYGSEHPLFGAWDKMPKEQRPNVYIQKQYCDPVSKFGQFKEDFHLVKTKLAEEPSTHKAIRLFAAHACHYATCDKATISFADMKEENASEARRANNYYLYHKARPVVFYGLFMPYFFFIKPIRPWIEKRAFLIMLTLLTLASALLFPAIAAAISALPIISAISSPILAAMLGSYVVAYVTDAILEVFNLPSYLKQLSKRPALEATINLIYDTLNLLSFGVLKSTVKLTKLALFSLPNFFSAEQPDTASIHSESYHLETENLDDHPNPSIYDKLQVFSLIILFYSIAFPIKLVFFDLPKKIREFFSPSEIEETTTLCSEEYFEIDLNDSPKDIDIEKGLSPKSAYQATGDRFFTKIENGSQTSKDTIAPLDTDIDLELGIGTPK